MMEEVNEDTNGESSFEFIGRSVSGPEQIQSEPINNQGPREPTVSTLSKDGVIENYFKDSVTLNEFPEPSKLPKFDANPSLNTVQNTNVMDSYSTNKSFGDIGILQTTRAMNEPDGSQFTYCSQNPISSTSVNSPVREIRNEDSPVQSVITKPSLKQNNQDISPLSPVSVAPEVTKSPSEIRLESATSLDIPHDFVTPSTFNYQTSEGINSDSQNSGNSFIGWIKHSVKGSDLLNKFAEKAKNSVDTVIYTLDPQMKEFMNSSGISLVVASESQTKISAIRDAFQSVFVSASVEGVSSQGNVATQPVGFSAAVKGAEERIFNLRQKGHLHPNQPIVAVENFLLETTPDNWCDIGCLLLQDPKNNLTIQTFTQATPVSSQYVHLAQDQTPQDYPLRWSGLGVPIGKIIGSALGVPHTEWHQAVTGVSRQELIYLAGKALAGQYKLHLNAMPQSPTLTM